MNPRHLVLLCSFSTLALASACSSTPPRNDTSGYTPAAFSQTFQLGTVSSIEVVPTASRPSGAGAVLGAVIGAVIGNQIGAGSGRAVATGVGAVGGAVIGNTVERRNSSDSEIYRVGVRFDNGRFEQFDYQRIDDLRIGDRVKTEGGQLHRV